MKIHLLRNKHPETHARIAACAANPHIAGAHRNNRRSYQAMNATIVSFDEFKVAPAADRCAHCCDAALVIRNRQRGEKGLAPVATWNE